MRLLRLLFMAAVGLVVIYSCLGLGLTGSLPPFVDVLGMLLVGWIAFLVSVIPRIQVHGGLAVSAAIYFVLFVLGLHYFLQWLTREITGGRLAWRWSWTTRAVITPLLMFLVGVASVGLLRQSQWLIGSPRPLYENRFWRRVDVACAQNLRELGRAIDIYRSEHEGRLPPDLQTLDDAVRQHPEKYPRVPMIKCPVSEVVGTEDGVTVEVNGSYIYLGSLITAQSKPSATLVTESPGNHRLMTFHVLHLNGTVEEVRFDGTEPEGR